MYSLTKQGFKIPFINWLSFSFKRGIVLRFYQTMLYCKRCLISLISVAWWAFLVFWFCWIHAQDCDDHRDCHSRPGWLTAKLNRRFYHLRMTDGSDIDRSAAADRIDGLLSCPGSFEIPLYRNRATDACSEQRISDWSPKHPLPL